MEAAAAAAAMVVVVAMAAAAAVVAAVLAPVCVQSVRASNVQHSLMWTRRSFFLRSFLVSFFRLEPPAARAVREALLH